MTKRANTKAAAAKPCPFCGRNDLEFSGDLNAVCCLNHECRAAGPDVTDEIEALAWAKWNTRAGEP